MIEVHSLGIFLAGESGFFAHEVRKDMHRRKNIAYLMWVRWCMVDAPLEYFSGDYIPGSRVHHNGMWKSQIKSTYLFFTCLVDAVIVPLDV
jgi:hypothetical protein